MSGRARQPLRRLALAAMVVALCALVAACIPSTPAGTPTASPATVSGTSAPTPFPKQSPSVPGKVTAAPSTTATAAATPRVTGTRTIVATSPATPVPAIGVVATPAIYSANGGGFSQIDPTTGQVVSTTSTTFSVRDIAVSPDGRLAYIVVGAPRLTSLPGLGGTSASQPTAAGTPTPGTSTGGGSLVVFDLTTRSEVTRVAVGDDPWAVALSRDGRVAYVSNRGDGTVSVVDTGLQSVTATLTAGSQPTGLAIIARNPVAPVVVTPSAVAGTRTPAAGTKVTPTSGTATRAVPTVTTTRSNGPFLYVANYGSDDVSVIDLSTNRAVSKVTVGADPVAIAADPTNNRVFVANVGSSDLSVIGIADNQVDSRVRLDGRPSSVGVSTDGRYVYATLIAPTNAVQVINPTLITAGGTTALLTPTAGASPTRTPTGAASTGTPAAGTPAASATAAPTSTPVGPTRIAVGDNPSYVIFNSQGTRAFVANEGAGSISVIDTVSGAVVSTALVTGTPSMLYLLVGSGAATPVAPTAASLTTPVATGTPLPSR